MYGSYFYKASFSAVFNPWRGHRVRPGKWTQALALRQNFGAERRVRVHLQSLSAVDYLSSETLQQETVGIKTQLAAQRCGSRGANPAFTPALAGTLAVSWSPNPPKTSSDFLCLDILLMNYCRQLIRICACFLAFASHGAGAEELVNDKLILTAHYDNGEVIPYMLTSNQSTTVKYALIVMPGGAGNLNPEIRDGKVSFSAAGNFLIRSRALFVDDETVVISTDATSSPERMIAIIADISNRYAAPKIYIIGTSRSTASTMKLAEKIDGKAAGFIHTSSMNEISSFDTRNSKSRQLIVHHKEDGCRVTRYDASRSNHEHYGTTLITMEGGRTIGNPCEGLGYHGFNGIEGDTVEKIKAWIKLDK